MQAATSTSAANDLTTEIDLFDPDRPPQRVVAHIQPADDEPSAKEIAAQAAVAVAVAPVAVVSLATGIVAGAVAAPFAGLGLAASKAYCMTGDARFHGGGCSMHCLKCAMMFSPWMKKSHCRICKRCVCRRCRETCCKDEAYRAGGF